jgi:hypothetical protein
MSKYHERLVCQIDDGTRRPHVDMYILEERRLEVGDTWLVIVWGWARL